MASLSTWFSLYAQSRPPRGSPPKNPSGGARNPALAEVKLQRGWHRLSSSACAEATTYTRLPPREDFECGCDSSSLPALQFSGEVRLSDSAAILLRPGVETLDDEIEIKNEEEEEGEGDWEARYGKFKVFEVDGGEEEEEEVYEIGGKE